MPQGSPIGQFANYLFVSFIAAYTSWLYINETKIFFAVSGWIFCVDPPHKHFASFGGEIVYARSAITVLTRLEFWKISFEQFVANPFMGIGFHLQEILGKLEIEKGIYYPHNYLFESLATGGILMTLPLFYCIFFPMVSFYKKLRIDPTISFRPYGGSSFHLFYA